MVNENEDDAKQDARDEKYLKLVDSYVDAVQAFVSDVKTMPNDNTKRDHLLAIATMIAAIRSA